MKKFLSKATAYLLALAVILGTGNLLSADMSVKAEGSNFVNVYDATTFGQMLETENVDIVLWQDISYEGTDTLLCNSVDLNGYNLTCSNTLTFGSGKRTFRILDSQYSSDSSNIATFSEGINIDDGTLKIESGVISVCSHGIYGTGNVDFIGGNTTIKGKNGHEGYMGGTGSAGTKGKDGNAYGYDGQGSGYAGGNGGNGYKGGNGYNVGNGIQVTEVTVYGGNVYVIGGQGGTGGQGGQGGTGDAGYNGGTGGTGGTGGVGGSGEIAGNGIQAINVTIYKGVLTACGGRGGTGGTGGTGGIGGIGGRGAHGYKGYGKRGGTGGTGGTGGQGGTAGNGGNGIQATNVTVYDGELVVRGGTGGTGGKGGKGGAGGTGGQGGNCYESGKGGGDGGTGGTGGVGGSGGNGGNGGNGILATDVAVQDGSIIAYGGEYGHCGNLGTVVKGGAGGAGGERGNYTSGAKGKIGESGIGFGKNGIDGDSGGAGINARLKVEAGTVEATGGKWSAGIGGTGNGQGIAGYVVNISGGMVTVTAGEKSFGIGGGFDGTKTGAAGNLTVTGGTLILSTSGRGTNVPVPTFTNCTVSGEGALQYEGTYNADGKFTVTVKDINIQPTPCIGCDTVTLTATVKISRSTNITTPKLKGYMSFRLDGQEFATASIEDAVSSDGVITAAASTKWTAVEGKHQLSAVYVSGENDKYAFGGMYAESTDIPLHTHKWNNEYTIDVQPTCTMPGSKSIHCNICDMQKDFVTIDAIGHNYVDHQCQNCREFSPLVIFKDYDGTIISSEYYYLGDPIIEPNTPSRKADNANTYTFIGWDKEVVACEGDAVYTAVYEATPIEYTVIFKNYDGSELLRDTYHYGDKVVTPSDIPQKPADSQYEYTFAGWDSIVCPCDGNKVYTAVFTSEFVEYTVSFKNYDGSIISKKTYHYGDAVQMPDEPSKSSDLTYSYAFAGWDKKVTAVTGNAVYTATYKATYIDYTVTFKDWNGTVLSTKTYHYGDKVNVPRNPNKVADKTYTYTFAGWDKAVVDCAGNATYTATYTNEYINYTVIFQYEDGTVIKKYALHYGDSVAAPTNPDVPAVLGNNYKFSGWDKSIITACQGNAVYTAMFVRKYTPGDLDGNEEITNKDAIYLLYHTFLPDKYPVNQNCDFNGDGVIDNKDAIYLLYYTFLPDKYPIK